MTLKQINIGGNANDGTGDDLRTAFLKVNENFTILDNDVTIANGKNLGLGVGLFAQRDAARLSFKSLVSRDNSVIITHTNETVSLQAKTSLVSDQSPTLGHDLNLNGYNIKAINGGNIEAPIYGVDVQSLNGMVQLLITSNSVSIDLGSILDPAGSSMAQPNGYEIDMNNGYPNAFLMNDPMPNNNYNFGNF